MTMTNIKKYKSFFIEKSGTFYKAKYEHGGWFLPEESSSILNIKNCINDYYRKYPMRLENYAYE